MITEDQLEQLAIQWFQDTGWSYANGAELAPEGVTPERADFRTEGRREVARDFVGLVNGLRSDSQEASQ